MENWSSKRIPAKYRYLQKHIDEIWKLREKLPAFSPDFSGLTPEERDLVETFYGYLLTVLIDHRKSSGDSLSNNTTISIDDDLIMPTLKRYLTDHEIKRARHIFADAPRKVYKGRDSFWTREDRPNLLLFLDEQQSTLDWLPQGILNDKNLTWTSWDELISIAKAYGYKNDTDSTKNLKSFTNLKNDEKRTIIRIYLEMINSEKMTNTFNAPIKDSNKKYILRKRFPKFCR